MPKTQAPRKLSAQKFVLEEQLETEDDKRSGTLQVLVNLEEYNVEGKWTPIGYMVGILVDKQIKASGKKGKTDLWVDELLRQVDLEAEYSDQTHGVREASPELYTKTGTVRAQLRQYQQELSSERFVFIDTNEIYTAYRIKGAGRQPMRMLLTLLPQVLGTEDQEDAPQVPRLLSPARAADGKIDNGKTGVEVEWALIKAYQKNKFNVWLQGGPDEEGSITIMGRMV